MRNLIGFKRERGEEQWVQDVLKLEAPKNQQDLRKMVFLLARGNISAMNLGKQGGQSEHGRSKENAGMVLQKLKELQQGVQASGLRALPESERLFRIVGSYERAFSGFLEGATWAAVPSDVGLLSATLDESDVRSVSRGVGFEKDSLKELRSSEDRKLIEEYREHSLLGPDTVNYLSHKVPVATLQYFLDSFTPEQLYACQDDINSPALATSVAADPGNMQYIDFVVSIVANRLANFDSGILGEDEYKAAYPDLDWSKPQHTLKLLFDTIPGTREEKCAFLEKNVRGHSLMLEDVVSLVKMPVFADGSFYKLCAEYEGTFPPHDVLSLLQHGCDLKRAKELYDSLPELMQGADVVIALQAVFSVKEDDDRKLQEFISYFDLDVDGETFATTMLPWFFDSYDKAKADITLLKQAGVRSFWHIYELSTEPRVPVEYSALIHSTVQDADLPLTSDVRKAIVEWYTEGVTSEDMRECEGLWDDIRGVPWYSSGADAVKAYASLKKEPAKYELLKYVCDTYDKVPAEVAVLVNEGYPKEVFDAVESRGLFMAWMPIFREFPQMADEFDRLSGEEMQSVLGASVTRDLLPKLRQTGSIAAMVRTLVEENRRWLAEQAKVDAYGTLLDKRAERHRDYVEYFSFFGVTPEYMSEKLALSAHKNELDDVLVNHIILCAYLENKIPQKQVALIEQNDITMFTRYPVDVLKSMADGYSSEPDRQKSKVAVALFAKTDWNNSLDNKSKVVQDMYAGHRTYIYEVATKAEFFRAIRLVGEQTSENGKENVSLIYFNGHGNDHLVQLGFPYSPRRTELTKSAIKSFAPLRRFMTPDAQVVLASCSAAEGGKDADNLAVSLARAWPGVEVFASNRMAGTDGIKFDVGNRVIAVDYSRPNALEIIKV